MPNKYEPFDAAHEFTWTARAAGNGQAPVTNGHVPATNGRDSAVVRAPRADDLEVATGSVLLFAQRVADDTIADARREAEHILEEACAARPPAPNESAPTKAGEPGIDELRERSEQLRVESRLRNLLMNDLVECVAELSSRVEREIGEAMQMLERARERAVADFSAINALARLAGLPTDPQSESPLTETDSASPRTGVQTRRTPDEPDLAPAPDTFIVDLRDALDDDRNGAPCDEFDELFAPRGVYMESRETRRSRWIRSAGLFSTVLGYRAG